MPRPEHKIKPNTTSVSNQFLDHLYWYSGNDVKIFSFITRKTIGWHKETQLCSLSYIMNGTGIKKKDTVIESLKRLMKDGWIIRERVNVKNGYSFEYGLSETVDIVKLETRYEKGHVRKSNQSKNVTGTSPKKGQATSPKKGHNKINKHRNKQSKETRGSSSKEILNKQEKALLSTYIEIYNTYSGRKTQGNVACQKQFKKFLKEAEYNPDLIEHTTFAFCNDRWRKDTGNNDLSYLFRAVNYSKYENITISQLNDLNFQYCKKAGLEHKNIIDHEEQRRKEAMRQAQIAKEKEEELEMQRKQAEYDALPEEVKFERERKSYILRGKYPMMRKPELDEKFHITDWNYELQQVKVFKTFNQEQ